MVRVLLWISAQQQEQSPISVLTESRLEICHREGFVIERAFEEVSVSFWTSLKLFLVRTAGNIIRGIQLYLYMRQNATGIGSVGAQ